MRTRAFAILFFVALNSIAYAPDTGHAISIPGTGTLKKAVTKVVNAADELVGDGGGGGTCTDQKAICIAGCMGPYESGQMLGPVDCGFCNSLPSC